MPKISSIPIAGACATACLFFAANAAFSAVTAQSSSSRNISATIGGPAPYGSFAYSDIADLAVIAPIIVNADISQVIALKPAQSAGVDPRYRRVYITARVNGLIRGEGGVAPTLSYLYDVPVDARGRIPKLKKRRVLLFARAGTRPGEIQLIAPDAQMDWSPGNESQVRSIAGELLAAKSPPKIVGLGDAFYVAGTVAGEGETQIFLRTESGEPVSLSIVRRPGQPPRWAVALGEIVDEAAATPKPGTLLWYRLACSLPPALPSSAVRTLAVPDAEAARADYQVVLNGLGACGRTRKPR